jgi:hypothetical protein
MLTGLNEGDWVALYNESDHSFLKVARIEHKFTLTGKEAKTYKKNFIEILMIRHKDRDDKILDVDGSIKCDYIKVDASSGKEIDGKHHSIIVEAVPSCRNIVFNGVTWNELIEKQKFIYYLSDVDWKTLSNTELKNIYNIMYKRE